MSVPQVRLGSAMKLQERSLLGVDMRSFYKHVLSVWIVATTLVPSCTSNFSASSISSCVEMRILLDHRSSYSSGYKARAYIAFTHMRRKPLGKTVVVRPSRNLKF